MNLSMLRIVTLCAVCLMCALTDYQSTVSKGFNIMRMLVSVNLHMMVVYNKCEINLCIGIWVTYVAATIQIDRDGYICSCVAIYEQCIHDNAVAYLYLPGR